MLWSSSITAIVGIDYTVFAARRCFPQSAWRECDGEEKREYELKKIMGCCKFATGWGSSALQKDRQICRPRCKIGRS
jgi:hypothetical protein